MSIKRAKLILAVSFFITSSSYAIDGIPNIDLEINGVLYKVPAANKDYEQDLYMLKKALKGDRDALEILLKGKDECLFYIGNESPKWLLITKNEFKILNDGERYGKTKKD